MPGGHFPLGRGLAPGTGAKTRRGRGLPAPLGSPPDLTSIALSSSRLVPTHVSLQQTGGHTTYREHLEMCPVDVAPPWAECHHPEEFVCPRRVEHGRQGQLITGMLLLLAGGMLPRRLYISTPKRIAHNEGETGFLQVRDPKGRRPALQAPKTEPQTTGIPGPGRWSSPPAREARRQHGEAGQHWPSPSCCVPTRSPWTPQMSAS